MVNTPDIPRQKDGALRFGEAENSSTFTRTYASFTVPREEEY